jgi:hypothetical protein
MSFLEKAIVNEIVHLGVKHTGFCQIQTIDFVFELFIFTIVLKVSLEIVTILSFFLGKSAKEIREVLDLTHSFFVEHALFTTLVVLRVAELSCVEFLNFVEDAIELFDRELNIIPVLKSVTTDLVLQRLNVLLHLFFAHLVSL